MKAYTLIEVIIVIGVLAILTGLTSLSVVSFGQAGDTLTAQTMVQAALKEARANSLAGLDDKSWGVHLEAERVIIFADSGAGFNLNDSSNSVRVLPGKTSLAWEIADGGAEIEFLRLVGKTNEPGTMTITGTGTDVKTVTVNAEGMIE